MLSSAFSCAAGLCQRLCFVLGFVFFWFERASPSILCRQEGEDESVHCVPVYHLLKKLFVSCVSPCRTCCFLFLCLTFFVCFLCCQGNQPPGGGPAERQLVRPACRLFNGRQRDVLSTVSFVWKLECKGRVGGRPQRVGAHLAQAPCVSRSSEREKKREGSGTDSR